MVVGTLKLVTAYATSTKKKTLLHNNCFLFLFFRILMMQQEVKPNSCDTIRRTKKGSGLFCSSLTQGLLKGVQQLDFLLTAMLYCDPHA